MMKKYLFFALIICCISCNKGSDKATFADSFVQVSVENPQYFVLSNGDPYIAIGCNIAAMSDEQKMEKYIKLLCENGANFGRVWLNSALFEVETTYGVINEVNLSHVDRLLELAAKYDIKIKMCIESFRFIEPGSNKWDTKASYHKSNGGPFDNMWEYLNSEDGKKEYLRRLTILKNRYGDNPAVFGWELWNEMNAVNHRDYDIEQNYPLVEQWTQQMLIRVKQLFPRNLVMQSLGSLDSESCLGIYKNVLEMPENEVAQVHRYLDLGAELNACHASMDSLCSDATRFAMDLQINKPVFLAEGGAVQPVHTGPSLLYELDSTGVLLHDVLFTPFFCGSAGSGHIWHWDHYIEKQNVWFQFSRFAEAVKGINPIAEKFSPKRNDNDDLKVYTLHGDKTILVWCRDKSNDWQSEFDENTPPRLISGVCVDLSQEVQGRKVKRVEIYDPWTNEWSDGAQKANVNLPDFKRSIVVKVSM